MSARVGINAQGRGWWRVLCHIASARSDCDFAARAIFLLL